MRCESSVAATSPPPMTPGDAHGEPTDLAVASGTAARAGAVAAARAIVVLRAMDARRPSATTLTRSTSPRPTRHQVTPRAFGEAVAAHPPAAP